MSFYDNLVINQTQLPLSKADAQRVKAGRVFFQTQSLEGMYGAYEITADGHLEKTASSGVIGPDGKTIWHAVRMVDAHGFVVVYTNVDEEWFCFKVRFRQGRVTQLIRLNEIPEIYSRTCTWELEIPVDEIKGEYDTKAIQRELSLLDARQRLRLDEEFADFDQRFPKAN